MKEEAGPGKDVLKSAVRFRDKSLKFNVLLLITAIPKTWIVSSVVISSAGDMKNIIELGKELVTYLNEPKRTLQVKMAKVNSPLKGVPSVMAERDKVDTDEEFIDKVIGNPVHTDTTVRRFLMDQKKFEMGMARDTWKDYKFKMKRIKLSPVVPLEGDFTIPFKHC